MRSSLLSPIVALLASLAGAQVPTEPVEEIVVQTPAQAWMVHHTTLALSPGGTLLAAAGGDMDRVFLWDVSARRKIAELSSEIRGFDELKFFAGGSALMIVGPDEVALWNLATDHVQRYDRAFYLSVITSDATLDDGKVVDVDVASSGLAMASVDVVGSRTAARFHPAPDQPSWNVSWDAKEVAVSADGDRIVVLGALATTVWDTEAREVVFRHAQAPNEVAESLIMSSDGRRFAFVHVDNDDKEAPAWVHVHDADRGERLRAIELASRSKRVSLAFTPDGEELIVGVESQDEDQPGQTFRVIPIADDRPGRGIQPAVNKFTVRRGLAVAAEAPVAAIGVSPFPRIIALGPDLDLGPIQERTTSALTYVTVDAARGEVYALGADYRTMNNDLLRIDLKRGEVRRLRSTLGMASQGWILGIHARRMLQLDGSGRPVVRVIEDDRFLEGPELPWLAGSRPQTYPIATTPELSHVGTATAEHVFVAHVNDATTVLEAPRPPPADGSELGEAEFVALDDGELFLLDTAGWIETWSLEAKELTTRVRVADLAMRERRTLEGMRFLRSAREGGEAGATLQGGRRGLFLVPDDPDARAKRLGLDAVDAGEVALSPRGRFAAQSAFGAIAVYDLQDAGEKRWIQTDDTQPGVAFLDDERLVHTTKSGGVAIVDLESLQPIVHVYVANEDDSIFLLPDNHYKATRGALGSVALRTGSYAESFASAEATLHRPDLVLRQIGGDPELADDYAELLARREGAAPPADPDGLRPTVWFAERPSFVTAEREVRFALSVYGPRELARLHVHVDGVPLVRRDGEVLEGVTSVDEASGYHHATLERTIALIPGVNRITFVVEDVAGQRSIEVSWNLTCTAPERDRRVFALALGVSRYAQPGHDLRFAASDAERFAREVRLTYGDAANVLVPREEEITHEAVGAWRAFLEQAAYDDMVLVLIAGHGLRDDQDRYWFAAHDVDFDAPRNGGIGFDDLQDLLDGLRARRKVLFMDTCNAGDLGDGLGGDVEIVGGARGFGVTGGSVAKSTIAPGLLLDDTFADLRRGSGAAIIAAAGGREYAYETDELGGVFTGAVIEGLARRRADADRTLSIDAVELAGYVADRVSALTDGRQRPVAKRENFGYEFPLLAAEVGEQVRDWFGPREHSLDPGKVSVSADGSRIVVHDSLDHVIEVLDTERFETVTRLAGAESSNVWLTPDGSHLIHLIEKSGKVIRVGDGHALEFDSPPQANYLQAPVFADDPSVVLVPGGISAFTLWRLGADRVEVLPLQHPDVGSFASAGLAAGGATARLISVSPSWICEFDTETGEPLSTRPLTGLPEMISTVLGNNAWMAATASILSMSPDARFLGVRMSGFVAVWDLDSAELLVPPRKSDAQEVFVTPSGPVALLHPDGWSEFRPPDDGPLPIQVRSLGDELLATHESTPGHRAWIDPTGRAIAFASGTTMGLVARESARPEREIVVVDARTGGLLQWAESIVWESGFRGSVHLAFAPDGSAVYAGTSLARLLRWGL